MMKIIAILLALIGPAAAQTTETFPTYITGLATATSLTGPEYLYVLQGGTSKKVSAQSVGALATPTAPGGSNTQVQFNNSGAFGGNANLTFVSPTLIATTISPTNLTAATATVNSLVATAITLVATTVSPINLTAGSVTATTIIATAVSPTTLTAVTATTTNFTTTNLVSTTATTTTINASTSMSTPVLTSAGNINFTPSGSLTEMIGSDGSFWLRSATTGTRFILGSSADLALAEQGPSVVEINNGTVGTGPGLMLLRGSTFANLPGTPVEGMIGHITDGLAANCGDGTCTTFGTTVSAGTGALKLLVWRNGTNWTLIGK